MNVLGGRPGSPAARVGVVVRRQRSHPKTLPDSERRIADYVLAKSNHDSAVIVTTSDILYP